MRATGRLRYLESWEALGDFKLRLKLLVCPHCGASETLNAHGPLRGYAENSSEVVVRGWRAYCSNRGSQDGCGRTFSALLAGLLRGFGVRAATLEAFVVSVLSSLSRAASWRLRAQCVSLRSGYRLWQRLSEAQSRLRSRLLTRSPIPQSQSDEPLDCLKLHLEAVLGKELGLFSRFQLEFQQELLG